MDTGAWKKCSTCKKPIPFGARYWVCNVTTCNSKRTGLSFCSVACWDGHVPIFRHRDSWSIEKQAPTQAEWERIQAGEESPRPAPASGGAAMSNNAPEREILVVVSKLKAYIRQKSGGMNTANEVMETLSDQLRKVCDEAILSARQDGRKTVMSRDFK